MSSRANTNLKIGTLVLILLLGVIILAQFIHPQPRLVAGDFKFAFSEPSQDDKSSQNLAKIIDQNLKGKSGDYAIYIEELSVSGNRTDPEFFSLRSSEPFPAASL